MKWPRISRARVQWLRRFMRWFVPGLGVKRWVLLALAGMTVLGMGLALFLHETYVIEYPNDALLSILSILALRFLPGWLRYDQAWLHPDAEQGPETLDKCPSTCHWPRDIQSAERCRAHRHRACPSVDKSTIPQDRLKFGINLSGEHQIINV